MLNCLCVPIITFELISRFYEIQYDSHAIEVDLDPIVLNPVASATTKLLMFEIPRRYIICTSQRGTMKLCTMVDLQKMDNKILIRQFL
jgi:hypothetical protein